MSSLDPTVINNLKQELPSSDFKGLIQTYLQSSERYLAKLNQSNTDIQSIYHITHTLKSSSASLAALDLSKLCQQLETNTRQGNTTHIHQQIQAINTEFEQVKVLLTRYL